MPLFFGLTLAMPLCIRCPTLILFIWLVKRHNFWFYRKDFLKKKIEINEQELRAMQYDFSDF